MTPNPSPVPAFLRRWWPECLLLTAAGFFFFRELGTFPELWLDEALFMIVARNVAEGYGYVLPVLDTAWHYPFLLAVGPTVILPSALGIRMLGMSVAAARMGQVMYLVLASAMAYRYAMHIGGRMHARWAAALLISFSAFVNTGKPVMGEIPGFVFLLGMLLCFDRGMRNARWAVAAGLCAGLAFVSKTTMGLVFPALSTGVLIAIAQKHWRSARMLTVMLCCGLAISVLCAPVLGMTDPAWVQEILQYGAAEGGRRLFNVLREQPYLLLRFQYLSFFLVTLPLGVLGIMRSRSMSAEERATVMTFATLIVIYFLNERGYYRHLLPAHLAWIPFVPLGAYAVIPKQWPSHIRALARLPAIALAIMVMAQGLWQLTHQGSRRLNEARDVLPVLQRDYAQTDMVIQQPEVFVQLPRNPHWRFLSEEFTLRTYPLFSHLPRTQEEYCLPLLRKMSEQEKASYPPGRITPLARRYVLVAPPEDCTSRAPGSQAGSRAE